MPVAAIGDEKGDESANSLNVGTIDYGTAVARAAYQSGSSKNAQVRRERVMRTPDHVGDRASRKAIGFRPHESPKYLEPSRLAQCRECSKSMRRRHRVPGLLRADMADNSQVSLLHQSDLQQ